MFIKKNVAKIRMYSDDIIESLKPYFTLEEFCQNAKIFLDNEFDEYIYIVVKGVIGCLKSINKISFLKEKLSILGETYASSSHVILEKFIRGDIFGVYSALKHHKNNYTAEVISEKASIYKIAKAHVLLYFGGSSGSLPNAFKGIDTVQQNSIKVKLEFLSNIPMENLNELMKFSYKKSKENSIPPKIMVDETQINNFLKDAWKELESMESKVLNFKTNLFKPSSKAEVPSSILSKIKDKDLECTYICQFSKGSHQGYGIRNQ